jgi:lysozyme
MNSHLVISEAGFDLIKSFEGLRLKAYYCPAGVLTIGYGHTSAAGSPRVVEGMTITAAQADEILRRDMEKYADAVRRLVKVQLNQSQFDALVSFTFNLGADALRKSTLLKRLNAGKYDAAPAELMKWTRAGGKELEGLVRRRRAEAAMWRSMTFDRPVGLFDLPKEIDVPAAPTSEVTKAVTIASPILTAASYLSDWKVVAVLCVAALVGGAAWYLLIRKDQ